MKTTNNLKKIAIPKDYMRHVKRYMESIGLQCMVILKTDENCIILIEDNLINISKFIKLKKFLAMYDLEFSWRNIESNIMPQIEIMLRKE